jgi:hypothetical protein
MTPFVGYQRGDYATALQISDAGQVSEPRAARQREVRSAFACGQRQENVRQRRKLAERA